MAVSRHAPHKESLARAEDPPTVPSQSLLLLNLLLLGFNLLSAAQDESAVHDFSVLALAISQAVLLRGRTPKMAARQSEFGFLPLLVPLKTSSLQRLTSVCKVRAR